MAPLPPRLRGGLPTGIIGSGDSVSIDRPKGFGGAPGSGGWN